MKLVKIVTVVVSLHVFIIGLVMFQSGCNTLSQEGRCGKRTCADMVTGEREFPFDVTEDEIFKPNMNTGYVMEEESVQSKKVRGSLYNPTRPAWNLVMEETPEEETPTAPTPQKSKKEVLKPIKAAKVKEKKAAKQEVKIQVKEEMPKVVVEEDEVYEVKSGDSLWKIAKKKGVTVNDLAQHNHMRTNVVLQIGQKMKIPGGCGYQEVVAKKVSSAPEVKLVGAPVEGMYTIRQGDTLGGIAKRFGVTVSELRRVNGIKGNTIIAGKTIVIPDEETAGMGGATLSGSGRSGREEEKEEITKPGTHRVKRGETISVIAQRYGIKVQELMALNHITDARKLMAGQVLKTKEEFLGVKEEEVKALAEIKEPEPEVIEEVSMESIDFIDDDSMFEMGEEIPVVSVSVS